MKLPGWFFVTVPQSIPPPFNQSPYAPQKSHRPLDAAFRPTQFILDRRSEQHEEARSICSECFDHLVGIDSVAETLRHCFPFVRAFNNIRYHALRQQTFDWFVEVH